MKTFFGFKEVGYSEKASLVKEVFSSVASNYDLMNDFMSFGLHRLWKRYFVNMIKISDGNKIIDMAGGTADISFLLNLKARDLSKKIDIFTCDINHEMLSIGREKFIDKNLKSTFVNCDAEILPFGEGQIDVYVISFGMRNVTDMVKALNEAYRVLKPGGMFYCLEFAPFDSFLYNWYSFNIIPNLGEIVSSNKEAYNYLVESIRKFPKQQDFADVITSCGFSNVSYKDLSCGIVAIHSAVK